MIIIAQLKNYEFRKLLDSTNDIERFEKSNQQLFKCPVDSSNESINFLDNPSYKLDDNQFFYIAYNANDIASQIKAKIKETVYDMYTRTIQTADICNISKAELSSVLWICSYCTNEQQQIIMNLQHVTKAKYVENTHFLSYINDHVIYQTESNRLEVYDRVDVSINHVEDKIYFKNFAHLKKINNEFNELYKEASKEQQNSFLEKINNSGVFNINQNIRVEPSNLKHIRFLIEQGFELDTAKLNSYIDKYQNVISIERNNDKYYIKENKDVTLLIKLLNESFYTGELTGKKRESNSSKIIIT